MCDVVIFSCRKESRLRNLFALPLPMWSAVVNRRKSMSVLSVRYFRLTVSSTSSAVMLDTLSVTRASQTERHRGAVKYVLTAPSGMSSVVWSDLYLFWLPSATSSVVICDKR